MLRRLTTIVAADVAGFSRLVGADEEGVLSALRSHGAELIDPLLARHGGRIANTAGDSLLVEFPSAVEAMRCAPALQDGMRVRNAALTEERRIVFRVGVNVGDVVAEGGDLLGDGMNVAARLEALCPPGGIVLSGSVRDAVRDRLPLRLADLGEVAVKKIPPGPRLSGSAGRRGPGSRRPARAVAAGMGGGGGRRRRPGRPGRVAGAATRVPAGGPR